MDYQWTLEELTARYTFEPGLADVYVEGQSDKRFVDWYLRSGNLAGVAVYSIDRVEVPADILDKHQLPPSGNRSRVLALACELEERFPRGLRAVCLADRDFDDHLPTTSSTAYLVLTDPNSLDLYAFTPATMDKFTSIALGGRPFSCNQLMDELTRVLELLFAYRAANQCLGWGMEWVPLKKNVKACASGIAFDESKYVRKYLQKNNRWEDRAVFEGKVSEVLTRMPAERGRRVRGHDLCELLLCVVQDLVKDRTFGSAETLEACLLAAVERDALGATDAFRRITDLATS